MRNFTKILNNEWLELSFGVRKAEHSYHTFTFCTIFEKIPEARTVVLRNANKSRNFISFHSDIRSKKYLQLKDNNNVCALFYDKSRKVQLRVNGVGSVEHKSKSCVKSWNKMSKESKICYLAPLAPSSTTSKFIPNLPSMTPHQITDKDEAYGYQNFCIINIKISKIDWLQLDHKGHKRILFEFNNDFSANWIAS